jgi:hypothetical protein
MRRATMSRTRTAALGPRTLPSGVHPPMGAHRRRTLDPFPRLKRRRAPIPPSRPASRAAATGRGASGRGGVLANARRLAAIERDVRGAHGASDPTLRVLPPVGKSWAVLLYPSHPVRPPRPHRSPAQGAAHQNCWPTAVTPRHFGHVNT